MDEKGVRHPKIRKLHRGDVTLCRNVEKINSRGVRMVQDRHHNNMIIPRGDTTILDEKMDSEEKECKTP